LSVVVIAGVSRRVILVWMGSCPSGVQPWGQAWPFYNGRRPFAK